MTDGIKETTEGMDPDGRHAGLINSRTVLVSSQTDKAMASYEDGRLWQFNFRTPQTPQTALAAFGVRADHSDCSEPFEA